jgi:hypothetical protein
MMMPDDCGNMFEVLEPPGGGPEMLRRRLKREPARRLQLVAAFLLLAATLGVATQLPYGGEQSLLPEFGQARMRLGIGSQPSEPLTIPEGDRSLAAAHRVPLPTDEVLFYLVGSIDQPESKKQEL